MRVERFLANALLLRQVIHGYAAEAMAEEVHPRAFYNSLPTSIGGFGFTRGLRCLVSRYSLIHMSWSTRRVDGRKAQEATASAVKVIGPTSVITPSPTATCEATAPV